MTEKEKPQKKIRINGDFVKKVPLVDKGKLSAEDIERKRFQTTYRDEADKGFALRVGRDKKTFIVEGWIRGAHQKACRYTIGDYPDFTAEAARAEAKEILSKMAKGIDPNAEKAANKAEVITLRELLENYISSKKKLRPETIKGYRQAIIGNENPDPNRKAPIRLQDWLDKPITAITEKNIELRFNQMSEANGLRGKGEAQANLTMRVLRALLTYASKKYGDKNGNPLIATNPVKSLAGEWNRVPRREGIIQTYELEKWMDCVESLKKDTMRDYLLLCLFTGLRRNEAAQLTWNNVDLKARTLTIPPDKTKNHEEHRLPLSDYLFKLLDERRKSRKRIDNPYVFPGASGDGHLVESKWTVKEIVGKNSGVKFMIHDLRRTFLTIAEGRDISHYALKRLANHKDNSDVTAGYIAANVERLRAPMQLITDFILQEAGRKKKDEETEAPAAGKHPKAISS